MGETILSQTEDPTLRQDLYQCLYKVYRYHKNWEAALETLEQALQEEYSYINLEKLMEINWALGRGEAAESYGEKLQDYYDSLNLSDNYLDTLVRLTIDRAEIALDRGKLEVADRLLRQAGQSIALYLSTRTTQEYISRTLNQNFMFIAPDSIDQKYGFPLRDFYYSELSPEIEYYEQTKARYEALKAAQAQTQGIATANVTPNLTR